MAEDAIDQAGGAGASKLSEETVITTTTRNPDELGRSIEAWLAGAALPDQVRRDSDATA